MRYRINYGKFTNIGGHFTFLMSVVILGITLFESEGQNRIWYCLLAFGFMAFTFLRILPLYSPKAGYIEVSDTAFIKHIWPITRTLRWSEIVSADQVVGNQAEFFLVGTRHDGTLTRRISISLESPPESDWWAEVLRQMDAHGIAHPGLASSRTA